MDHRKRLYCKGVSGDGKLLEIGAGYNPVFSKAERPNYFVLDHASTRELAAKYQGEPLFKRIETVDFVWCSGLLHEAVPAIHHGTFEGIIASHVLEHIPDPLSFLRSMEILLAPHGTLMLAMPDKRFIFDFFKPVTVTSDYLYTYYQKRVRHTKKAAFDSAALQVSGNGQITWGPQTHIKAAFFHKLEDAMARFEGHQEAADGPHSDLHATVYTPASFDLIMLELRYLGFIGLEAFEPQPALGCEFYRFMRRASEVLNPATINERRLELMKKMVVELSEQASLLV
jgi:SAM-dependent methyltransferase